MTRGWRFLTDPPEVSPDVAERLHAARPRAGAPLSHDRLFEATTPHIASPDVHVDVSTPVENCAFVAGENVTLRRQVTSL